jgi:hypothetical protein
MSLASNLILGADPIRVNLHSDSSEFRRRFGLPSFFRLLRNLELPQEAKMAIGLTLRRLFPRLHLIRWK